MASTDITLIGLDEATLSDDLVTVLADPSTNGGYKASVGDLADYIIANAGLDYTDTATNGTYVKAVSESDGVISVTRETADTVPTEDSTKLITSGGVESALSMDLTSVSGNPITITDASNTNCETLVATLSPTQAGTGDPSPTNVRPISGVNQLSVNRTGKNIAPFVDNAVSYAEGLTVTTTSDGGIHISGTPNLTWATLTSSISAYIPSGTTITLCRRVSRNYNIFVTLTYTDASTSELRVDNGQISNTLTLSKDVSAIQLHLAFLSTSTNYDETIYPQLVFGSATTLSLSLGSTVYGGSVDLRSGVLTVDRVAIDLASQTIGKTSGTDGDTNYIYQIGNSDLSARGDFSEPTLFKSNVTTYSSSLPSSGGQFTVRTTPGTGYFYFNIGELSTNTVAGCKARLTELGAKLVYPLATPTTTQLTPQELRLLTGNNTLWTNGESLEVQYQPNNFVGKLKAWILDQLS